MVGRPEKLKGLDHHEDKTRLNSTTKVHTHCTCTDTRYQVCVICVWWQAFLEGSCCWKESEHKFAGGSWSVGYWSLSPPSTAQRTAPLRVLAFRTSEPPAAACSAPALGRSEGREGEGGYRHELLFLSWAVDHFSLVWWATSDVFGNFVRQLGLLYFQGEVFIHGR